ncbi:hypothetical protein ACU8DI_10145 [Psychroserpens sp. BH13MA-6]
MRFFVITIVFFYLGLGHAQVGIGTTNPDASSLLDIDANDKGVLVPRVSLVNVSNTTAPINAPATGLLVWNTNAVVIGGNGVGFYFFNGLQWMPIQQTPTDDSDFYEEGTTTAPNDINDDLFTLGYLAIGKTTADYVLDIYETANSRMINLELNANSNTTVNGTFFTGNNAGTGKMIGHYVDMQNQSSTVYGFANYLVNNLALNVGFQNLMSSDSSAGQFGLYSSLAGSGTGENYGVYNLITGNKSGEQFGVYNSINNSGNAQHFGVDNILAGTGTGIQVGTRNTIINSGSNTHYGVYNLLGSGPGNQTGVSNHITNGSGTSTGTLNLIYGNNSGLLSGVTNQISATGGASSQYGVRNTLSGGGSGSQYGVSNRLIGTNGTGDRYGSYNFINSTTPGTHFGLYSEALKSGSYAGFFLGNVSIGTTLANTYVLPASRGTNGQIMATDGTGNVNWVDNLNPVSVIPLFSGSSENLPSLSGADVPNMDGALEPAIYNATGNIEIKLVIRYINATGTNNLQLRVHDGTTETFPIVFGDAWTYSSTQTGGVATSPWKTFNAGTNAHEVHVHGWSNFGAGMTIVNAYLLVRSQ